MAYIGIDDNSNNNNNPTDNYSTGNGGGTDWNQFFNNYWQQNQTQQQQQPPAQAQQSFDDVRDPSGSQYGQQQQQASQPRFGSTDTLNGQPYYGQQQQQQGAFRGGYGFDQQGDPYSQYNQQQQDQVGRIGNMPTYRMQQPTLGQQPPDRYGVDMGGNTQLGQFLGPYNRQQQQNVNRYAQGLPQPPGMSQGQQQPMQKTAAQFGQEPLFQQALEANVQHPGWNQGEAGPPGSPDFVRHPQTPEDWQNRFYYFEKAPEQAMPDYKPTNAWYQQNDPKAIANLQALAGGQAHDPYMSASGAASQLAQWGVQGAGEMEQGNPQNPMGILHKGGMRYDVATGKNLGPDALPRPVYGGGGGGGYAPRSSGGYAPRTTYSPGSGGKGLPAPVTAGQKAIGGAAGSAMANLFKRPVAPPVAPAPNGGWFGNGVNALEQELAMLNPHKKFIGHL